MPIPYLDDPVEVRLEYHVTEAERLLGDVARNALTWPHTQIERDVARAQAHATTALALVAVRGAES